MSKTGAGQTRGLTPKQFAFVNWYCSAAVNGNGTEAARRAGYSGTAKVLAQVACENLRKPDIRELIDAKLSKALTGAGITVETVLWDLQRATELAMERQQYSAAIRAIELKGKWLGMFSGRIEHTQNLEEISEEELDSLLGEMLGKGQIDITRLLKGYAAGRGGDTDLVGSPETN